MHGRQTHFTCVEKINAKRLKKQLPHKLRSAQFGVQLQIGGYPESGARGEGRGGERRMRRIKLATKGHASSHKQTNKQTKGKEGREEEGKKGRERREVGTVYIRAHPGHKAFRKQMRETRENMQNAL